MNRDLAKAPSCSGGFVVVFAQGVGNFGVAIFGGNTIPSDPGIQGNLPRRPESLCGEVAPVSIRIAAGADPARWPNSSRSAVEHTGLLAIVTPAGRWAFAMVNAAGIPPMADLQGYRDARMDTIRCEPLKQDDAGQMIRLVARIFSSDEPMGSAVGLSSLDMEQFLRSFVSQMVDDGLTVVARDTNTGDLAGALITDDFACPLPVEMETLSPKFLPIFEVLGQLDDNYRQGKEIPPGHYLHLFILATDRGYRGRGVSQQMISACLENGIGMGYRHAVTEATGVVSQHIFRTTGFVERYRVLYQDFRHMGDAPFAHIQGHTATILMDKALDAKRT